MADELVVTSASSESREDTSGHSAPDPWEPWGRQGTEGFLEEAAPSQTSGAECGPADDQAQPSRCANAWAQEDGGGGAGGMFNRAGSGPAQVRGVSISGH